MEETKLGWFDHNGKNQMGWRYNADLAQNCQNPSGDPLNDGITDEISKLRANIGVINPSGGRRLGVIKLSLKVPRTPSWIISRKSTTEQSKSARKLSHTGKLSWVIQALKWSGSRKRSWFRTPSSRHEETISGEARGPTKGWVPCDNKQKRTGTLGCICESRASMIREANGELFA